MNSEKTIKKCPHCGGKRMWVEIIPEDKNKRWTTKQVICENCHMPSAIWKDIKSFMDKASKYDSLSNKKAIKYR